MKKAISISLGACSRDKSVEVRLLGRPVHLERRGTGGDARRAGELFKTLDGRADAFGIGGIALSVNTPWRAYPLKAGQNLIKAVSRTPYTDGSGLQSVLERRVMAYAGARLGTRLKHRKVFIVEGLSRYGMIRSFMEAGYSCVFGDLMFALGLPVALKSLAKLEQAARLLLPVVSRLPARMLYSTGASQETVKPRYEKYYREAEIIAGDWLYIKKHMPENMEGKIIVTNTTTEEDVAFMRRRGITSLITTTPVFGGRSFGTNAFEAALIAAAGRGRPLNRAELTEIIDREQITPQLRELK